MNMQQINVKMDPRLKAGAERAFNAMGLSFADGIRAYCNYVMIEGKLPFVPAADPWYAHNHSSHIPNAETARAIRNAGKGTGLHEFNSMEDFHKWLDKSDDDDAE